MNHKYYSVGRGNSTYMDYTPAPDCTCGHKHRTVESAEKCFHRLLGFRKEFGKTVCSATWYNGYILGRTENGWKKIV